MFFGKIGNNKAARSVFYIIFISGLLSLTSTAIMLIWNSTIIKLLELASITFLEAVGIVSFVYVVYFGIKFGEQTLVDKMSEEKLPYSHAHDKTSCGVDPSMLNRLSPVDKQEMIELLGKCCGYKISQNDDIPSSNPNDENEKKKKIGRRGLDYIL
jgi:hypothetical protein